LSYVIIVTDNLPFSSYPDRSSKPFKEHKMKINVGTIDRTLRIVAGLALVALAATGTVGVWGWIGVVPLLTGIFKFCPAYGIFGLSTCPMNK
jgi:hypothetical protein